MEFGLYIRHLFIAQRSRRRDKKERIAYHALKVQALHDSTAVYTAKAENSATQLKDWVVGHYILSMGISTQSTML